MSYGMCPLCRTIVPTLKEDAMSASESLFTFLLFCGFAMAAASFLFAGLWTLVTVPLVIIGL
jgi:hypothetical protein